MPYHLQDIPRFEEKISWVYVEHGAVEKDDDGVYFVDKSGRMALPIAALAVLMLGPGTKITHRAVQASAEMNCLIAWTGEGGTRMYAHSTGGTGHARNLRRQAQLWAEADTHLAIVHRMYAFRFKEQLPPDLPLAEVRGHEGRRVRRAYETLAARFGVDWRGRNYEPGAWEKADLPNRCLSAANAALYGLAHAALVSVGYSPALGFIHTGRPLSFVYDIADLFKIEVAAPVAFEVAGQGLDKPERAVRKLARERFAKANLMKEVLSALEWVLNVPLPEGPEADEWPNSFPVEQGPDDAR